MNIPNILYKYTSSDTARIMLNSGRLRWSSPLLFNDLAEFQRMPRFEPSLDESLTKFPHVLLQAALGELVVREVELSNGSRLLLEMIRMLLKSGMDREKLTNELSHEASGADDRMSSVLRAAFDSLDLNTARVFCLTTEYDNDVMWAHYAEQHTGVVLGFKHLPQLDTQFLAARPVSYSVEPPIVGSGVEFLLYGDTAELRKKTLDAVCFIKSLRWQYENEWRVVTWRPEETGKYHGDYKFYPEELESICFGPRCDLSLYEEFRSMLSSRYPRCALYKLEYEFGESRRIAIR
ncbi:DUF2971 domain-containing protein [Oryzomonas rubra]|uniref:DUF2971 domain-containing protein n=1 Tax=Oryzomonas rubra TaxID=2509454 RepID=A0A5A9XAK4_9BACT|nr:DUF2971 domain-containing protein [Oryzomonas rubra]KAA0888691.1 DUF2971 domain-containing protein [Oryzomonas rubra]